MEFKLELKQEPAAFIDEKHVLGTFVIDDSVEQFIKTNTTTYLVRKHDQKFREITVPTLKLKNIQRWIMSNILATVKISECAHGFVKERSILTNVKAHIHTQDSWLLRIDIQNFFPSICIENVIEIFDELGYSEDVSSILSMLCTKDGKLCQGFPTSPMLANIFMLNFDNELSNFLKELDSLYELTYTRYADDIIVSGLKKEGYTKIVRQLKTEISNLLAGINLEINKRKTSVQKKDRKKVTGLYIEHNQIVLPQNFLKKLESDIYYCKKYGVLGHLMYHNILEIANFKGYMYGRVAFIKMINPSLSESFKQELDNLDW